MKSKRKREYKYPYRSILKFVYVREHIYISQLVPLDLRLGCDMENNYMTFVYFARIYMVLRIYVYYGNKFMGKRMIMLEISRKCHSNGNQCFYRMRNEIPISSTVVSHYMECGPH